MFEKTRPARDAFAFSLRGMRTVAAFTIAPVIADNRINSIRDSRPDLCSGTGPSLSLLIEDALARYFVPSRRRNTAQSRA